MSVASAAIARTVQDRQPVGDGPYPDGSQVWCWSRIDNPGAKKRRIRHIWYHGTQQKAAVGLDIKSTSWRTWSRIPAHGTGAWRVDIVDEDGRVMKSLPFTVE
ncbi:MAG: DUF2914 domain-containing protein [Myxococcota bacterium]|nr:DUF2914 domain-containing protein [Myxococcota bacterium]